MKTNYYIKNNLPKLPLFQTITIYIAIDLYEPSDIAIGIIWTIFAIAWIASIINVVKSKEVDLLDNNGKIKGSNIDFKEGENKKAVNNGK